MSKTALISTCYRLKLTVTLAWGKRFSAGNNTKFCSVLADISYANFSNTLFVFSGEDYPGKKS